MARKTNANNKGGQGLIIAIYGTADYISDLEAKLAKTNWEWRRTTTQKLRKTDKRMSTFFRLQMSQSELHKLREITSGLNLGGSIDSIRDENGNDIRQVTPEQAQAATDKTKIAQRQSMRAEGASDAEIDGLIGPHGYPTRETAHKGGRAALRKLNQATAPAIRQYAP